MFPKYLLPSKNSSISKIKIPPRACKKKQNKKKHHWRIIKTFPRPQPASQVASLSLSPISNDCRQQDKVLLNTHRCSLSKSWSLSGWRCCEAGPSQSHSRLALENRQGYCSCASCSHSDSPAPSNAQGWTTCLRLHKHSATCQGSPPTTVLPSTGSTISVYWF